MQPEPGEGPSHRADPFLSDTRAKALIDAVHVAVRATVDVRGPEGRALSEDEVVAESQHRFTGADGQRLDSNILPKEEPTINGSLLAAVTLVETAPFLLNPSSPNSPLTREEDGALDVILATVLVPSLGLEFEDGDGTRGRVDESFLRSRFGSDVATDVVRIVAGCHAVESGGSVAKLDPRYHDAVAATVASRLRLAARTVGEGLLSQQFDRAGRPLLPTYAQGRLLQLYGARSASEYLLRYVESVRRVIDLPGIRPDLAIKIQSQLLLPAVAATQDFEIDRSHLVGKHGTIPVYQNMLDLVRLGFDISHPFAMVLGGCFELARYAERSRRRDGEPLIAHSLRVEESLRTALGDITPTLWRAAIFHDFIEDSIWDTSHPITLVKRAGVAALVAFELSDPEQRGVDDVAKAQRFSDRTLNPKVTWARELYEGLEHDLSEEEYLQAVARKANPELPYSTEGAMIKLADFMDTMGAGLRAPERMKKDGWSQSGKRIGVHVNKQQITRNLFGRLAEDSGLLTKQSGLRVGQLLRSYAKRSRDYARNNVRIAAAERGIEDAPSFESSFFDTKLTDADFLTRWQSAFDGVQEGFDERMAVALPKLAEVYRPQVHGLQQLVEILHRGS